MKARRTRKKNFFKNRHGNCHFKDVLRIQRKKATTLGERTNPEYSKTLAEAITNPTPPSEPEGGQKSGESDKGLGMAVGAIPGNTVTTKDVVGMDEMVEAASLDNRNFIRVKIGGEAHLALLDSGATVSLVGPKILKKHRDRLQETSGQVRGVSGAPMKVQGTLWILIEMDGH